MGREPIGTRRQQMRRLLLRTRRTLARTTMTTTGMSRSREGRRVWCCRSGQSRSSSPLTHYDRDTFSWQPEGENAGGPSGLSFLVGPDGSAFAFRDEYLAVDDAGVLLRS